jgi:N6-L-threonylcarbamoyladenine synthase
MKKILAFETSCDDTAVAIVDEAGAIWGEAMYSQVKEYEAFGGVVPEIGSRAHIEQILFVTKKVMHQAKLGLSDIDAIAATFAPGLLGPLLVGANFAKGLALAWDVPLIAVHHIAGHIWAGYACANFPTENFLALIASGGHSALYTCDIKQRINLVGQTLDDAAGEAFDKIGRALGLGYPAGKKIDELAAQGNKDRFVFPIAMRQEQHFNFSFSGLKTRAFEYIKSHELKDAQFIADICAGVQEAIAIALSERTIKAALSLNISSIIIGGGVAANSCLRAHLQQACIKNKLQLFLPPQNLCTDNAVMIAKAAHIQLKAGRHSAFSTDVRANLAIEDQNLLYN